MKHYVRKRRVRMVFVLFLTLVLFLICAALPAFIGSSGKEVNVEVPATKDEPTQPVTTVPPVTSAATADEPAADGHKIDIQPRLRTSLLPTDTKSILKRCFRTSSNPAARSTPR